MAEARQGTGAAHPLVTSERPELLLFCGTAGLLGQIAPVVAIVWAVAVARHDIVADTVSDLARGPHHAIMDTGFYCNAAGLLALAIAAAHSHLGRLWWSVGVFCLAFLALVVTLLGIWDEFHSPAEAAAQGLSVHTRLSYALAPLYLAGPLAMRWGARREQRHAGWLFPLAALSWSVLAVAFKMAPDSYDGLLEKLAIGATMLWTVPLALLFVVRGRQSLRG